MSWYNFWSAKRQAPLQEIVHEPVVEEKQEEKVVPVKEKSKAPNFSDYPKSEYSAYWEIIVKDKKGELRFYPYKGRGLLDHNAYEGTSEEDVKEKMYRAVRTKMERYRV